MQLKVVKALRSSGMQAACFGNVRSILRATPRVCHVTRWSHFLGSKFQVVAKLSAGHVRAVPALAVTFHRLHKGLRGHWSLAKAYVQCTGGCDDWML